MLPLVLPLLLPLLLLLNLLVLTGLCAPAAEDNAAASRRGRDANSAASFPSRPRGASGGEESKSDALALRRPGDAGTCISSLTTPPLLLQLLLPPETVA